MICPVSRYRILMSNAQEVKENLLALMPEMPALITNLTEDKAQQIYNIFIMAKPEKIDKKDRFEALMDESQQWAKDVGLTHDDITRTIKEVRQENKQL